MGYVQELVWPERAHASGRRARTGCGKVYSISRQLYYSVSSSMLKI